MAQTAVCDNCLNTFKLEYMQLRSNSAKCAAARFALLEVTQFNM